MGGLTTANPEYPCQDLYQIDLSEELNEIQKLPGGLNPEGPPSIKIHETPDRPSSANKGLENYQKSPDPTTTN